MRKITLSLPIIGRRNYIINPTEEDVLAHIEEALEALVKRRRKAGLYARLRFELSPREVEFLTGTKVPGHIVVELAERGARFTLVSRRGKAIIRDLPKLVALFGKMAVVREEKTLKIEHKGRVQEFVEVDVNSVPEGERAYFFNGSELVFVDSLGLDRKVKLMKSLSERVVLVEGESDERILEVFAGRLGLRVGFVRLGGKDVLRSLRELPRGAKAVVDGDFDGPMEGVHVWERGEIEDYLLDAHAVTMVLREKGVEVDEARVEELIKGHEDKGSEVLGRVFGEFGLRYLKVRDGPRIARYAPIDGEIISVLGGDV